MSLTPPASVRPAKILVADDDRVTREVLAELFKRRGHAVELAVDGQAAVDRLAKGGIDLAIFDVVMPRLTGLEACRIAKSMSTSFLPVLLVTVKTDGMGRLEALRIGADDYVTKPFDEATIVAHVEALLRTKQLADHVQEAKRKLETMSSRDGMTGLVNYRHLQSVLAEEWTRAEREHQTLGCLLADVDGMSRHNDRLGREGGDKLIGTFARSVAGCLAEGDTLARFGGDELLALVPTRRLPSLLELADKVSREVTLAALREGVRMTVCLGVSVFPSREVKTKDMLLRVADEALSKAKLAGPGSIGVAQHAGYVYVAPPKASPEPGRS